jgi:hypothetical protein
MCPRLEANCCNCEKDLEFYIHHLASCLFVAPTPRVLSAEVCMNVAFLYLTNNVVNLSTCSWKEHQRNQDTRGSFCQQAFLNKLTPYPLHTLTRCIHVASASLSSVSSPNTNLAFVFSQPPHGNALSPPNPLLLLPIHSLTSTATHEVDG